MSNPTEPAWVGWHRRRGAVWLVGSPCYWSNEQTTAPPIDPPNRAVSPKTVIPISGSQQPPKMTQPATTPARSPSPPPRR
jgi:hypothetical protein